MPPKAKLAKISCDDDMASTSSDEGSSSDNYVVSCLLYTQGRGLGLL